MNLMWAQIQENSVRVQKSLRAGNPSFIKAPPRRTEEGFLDRVATWFVTLLSLAFPINRCR